MAALRLSAEMPLRHRFSVASKDERRDLAAFHVMMRSPIDARRRARRAMRMYGAALIALAGLCSPANAQTQCPELTRLRAEAVAAAKPTRGPPTPLLPGCETYIRISIAWNDVVKYAGDHREACNVSSPIYDAIEIGRASCRERV